MGEDYKAKIEVVLNNEDHVDMCLNGETTTLQNLAIGVMAQTIALGTFSRRRNTPRFRYSLLGPAGNMV